jgi:hypothetical protein
VKALRISIFVGLMYIAFGQLQNVTDIHSGTHKSGAAKLPTTHLPNRRATRPDQRI